MTFGPGKNTSQIVAMLSKNHYQSEMQRAKLEIVGLEGAVPVKTGTSPRRKSQALTLLLLARLGMQTLTFNLKFRLAHSVQRQ